MSETSGVLVVEDDDTIRKLLVEFLQSRAGTNVEMARDGVEALHQISTNRFGVIVLDVMMPKMSGVDLLDSMMAMMSDPSLKSLGRPPAVVVVTAMSISASELEQRFPQLVRAVFRKPIDMLAFGECVKEHLHH